MKESNMTSFTFTQSIILFIIRIFGYVLCNFVYLLAQKTQQLAAAEMRANTDQQQSLAEKYLAKKQVCCLCR